MKSSFTTKAIRLAIASTLAVAAGLSQAAPRDDAHSLIAAVSTQVSGKGLDGAVNEINSNPANWLRGSTYIFIADFKGNILAHSANPKLVGKNLWEAKDAGGKLLVQEQVQAMKSSGSASTQIRWMNPTTKRVGDAEVELKRIDGKEVFIGSPWFK